MPASVGAVLTATSVAVRCAPGSATSLAKAVDHLSPGDASTESEAETESGRIRCVGATSANRARRPARSECKTTSTRVTMRSTRTRRRTTRASGTGWSGRTAGSKKSTGSRSPDYEVAAFARSRRTITVRMLAADEADDCPFVLFEADASGLRFLARLFAAQAGFKDTGFFIGPRSAGNAIFSTKSDVGIYVQRTNRRSVRARGRKISI